MKEVVYLASNELPPDWCLIPSDKINSGIEARQKIEDLTNWKTVAFVYIGENQPMMPLSENDIGRTIDEFRFLFKIFNIYGNDN